MTTAKGTDLDLEPSLDAALPSACVGWLVGWSHEHGPVVDFPGNPGGPVAARATVGLDLETATRAIDTRQGTVLMFERGRPELPIIMGLMQELPAVEASVPTNELNAQVDGKRLAIEAKDEIVLRCGPASITLRRNGRVVIRGTQVETRAKGTNRVKGGSVQIN